MAEPHGRGGFVEVKCNDCDAVIIPESKNYNKNEAFGAVKELPCFSDIRKKKKRKKEEEEKEDEHLYIKKGGGDNGEKKKPEDAEKKKFPLVTAN